MKLKFFLYSLFISCLTLTACTDSEEKNDEQVIELLFKATVHHKWQFTKFCRDTIRENIKNTAKLRRTIGRS